MTKGQEWTDEFYVKFHTQGAIESLPDFIDRKSKNSGTNIRKKF
jgi:hypothetical protein